MKRLIACAILVLCFIAFALPVSAQAYAQDIGKNCNISGSGFDGFRFLTDGKNHRFSQSNGNVVINIKSEQDIGSLYVIFGRSYGEYTLTDTDSGKKIIAGKNGFLHEFIDVASLLGKGVRNISLEFSSGRVKLGEIYIFGMGQTPDFVQKWKASGTDKTDLMLFSTHGDDDQLYFAGLIPHYAMYKGYNIQVVYMTDHHNTADPRQNEMLDGLWATGVRSYPVFGEFDDFRIDDIDRTYAEYERRGFSKDELLSFVVEQIRKYKPPVVVGHDFNGEYGHGMHKVYADLLSKAVYAANDENEFKDTAEKYGVYDVQKAYFHIYEENPIVLDFDTPQECFGGLTAFQYTQQNGFPCHVSQLKYDFGDWLYGSRGQITKASQIRKYNPAKYGLFYTTVGEDIKKDDMFENVVFSKEESVTEPKPAPQEPAPAEQVPQKEENGRIIIPIIIALIVASILVVWIVMMLKKRK